MYFGFSNLLSFSEKKNGHVLDRQTDRQIGVTKVCGQSNSIVFSLFLLILLMSTMFWFLIQYSVLESPKKFIKSSLCCLLKICKSQESVTNLSQKSQLLGVTLLFKMVLRCHTVTKFSWKRSDHNQQIFVVFRMYSCSDRLKLMRKHSPAVFKENFKMVFVKDHAKEWFFPQWIWSDFGHFEREGIFFFQKLPFVFPWNLAWLILMDKRKFLSEPGLNCALRLI